MAAARTSKLVMSLSYDDAFRVFILRIQEVMQYKFPTYEKYHKLLYKLVLKKIIKSYYIFYYKNLRIDVIINLISIIFLKI